jgi:hypothetical protein
MGSVICTSSQEFKGKLALMSGTEQEETIQHGPGVFGISCETVWEWN